MKRWLYITPSGRALIVVICSKLIFLRGRRIASNRWEGRLPTIDGWAVAVYSESETSLWTYTALSGMWGSPTTGGLPHNLKRARDACVVYNGKWEGLGLKVALGDQDPSFEGGLGNLLKNWELYQRGLISIPPAIAAAREIRSAFPDIEAIMMPASPMESNAMRMAFARVILVRPEALTRLEPGKASTLTSVPRLLAKLITHRAPDRMASLEDPPGRKLLAAPRLAYFLARRRVAQAKDWLRRVFIEKPKVSCTSIREFLADLPKESPSDSLRAIGYLAGSLLEGWAAVLAALAALIGALASAGLL